MSTLWQWLLDALGPRTCAACDERLETPPWCRDCARDDVARDAACSHELEGKPLLSAGRYAPPLSTAIRRLKYDKRPELAAQLATLLRPALALAVARVASTHRPLALVPVPLHPTRLIERGYNQSALLARQLCMHDTVIFAPRALVRQRATEAQASTARDRRERNVAGAFTPRSPKALDGRGVILVDDVVTSGATLRGCEAAVRAAGGWVAAYIVIADARGNSG